MDSLLCRKKGDRLGGFVGASTWLPFAEDIREYLGKGVENSRGGGFVESMMSHLGHLDTRARESRGVLNTPVFLGHGVDDGTVDVELGRQAKNVLEQLGMEVEGKEYEGADLEGHWVKVPEEMDDIARFLRAVESRNK